MFRRRHIVIAASAAILALAVPGAGAIAQTADPALAAAIASPDRPAAARARDVYRHPEASLRFWGLKPGDTVIDVLPGSGWWTDIIAPYLARTHGTYIAAGADLDNPATSEGARRDRAAFEAKYAAHPDLYGRVTVVGFSTRSGPLAPAGTVDLVLISREAHNWVRNGCITKAFADAFAALKPGGVLAIEEHRAAEGADPAAGNGYLPESYVIAMAQKAGFRLAARSEINANPRDTKDYPFGVWTLPPTRQSSAPGQPVDPAFDRAKYDAIGESNRMTLKFVKPG